VKLADFKSNTKRHNLNMIRQWIMANKPSDEQDIDEANKSPMLYALRKGWDAWSYAGKYNRLQFHREEEDN
jgi:hypothetical protein